MTVDWANLSEIQKRHIEGIVERNNEAQKRLAPIYDDAAKWKGTVCEDIFLIGDIQIAEWREFAGRGAERKEISHTFATYINYKPLHTHADTLDIAVIAAICAKYHCEGAAEYIAKMLGMFDRDAPHD